MSRQENAKPRTVTTGSVRPMSQVSENSSATRPRRARARPIWRAARCWCLGSRPETIERKIRLSMPSTISSAVRVRRNSPRSSGRPKARASFVVPDRAPAAPPRGGEGGSPRHPAPRPASAGSRPAVPVSERPASAGLAAPPAGGLSTPGACGARGSGARLLKKRCSERRCMPSRRAAWVTLRSHCSKDPHHVLPAGAAEPERGVRHRRQSRRPLSKAAISWSSSIGVAK